MEIQKRGLFDGAKGAKGAKLMQHPKTKLTESEKKENMEKFLTSPMFEYLSDHCCKGIYFPPTTEGDLPMNWEVNGPQAQRLRDYVGRRNSIFFNGADKDTVAFINKYFGTQLKPVSVISGFAKRDPHVISGDYSSAPATFDGFSNLPKKLAPTKEMTAVDTSSMPDGTTVVYNNYPRKPVGSPAFTLKYCQIQNPFQQGGARISVAEPDCEKTFDDYGIPCDCGDITFLGWDWNGAGENRWDVSTVNAQLLSDFYGGLLPENKQGPFVGGPKTLADKVPETVVDRAPQGPPDNGLDPQIRDVIPEFEEQDKKWAFWAHNGGWRDICGPHQHPVYDPAEKVFYTIKKDGSSIFKKHWCGCYKKGIVEVETKQGVDKEGCEEMPDARAFMSTYAPRGKDSQYYFYTGPGYDHQRVLDRREDKRYDERYPIFVSGNGGDEGVWMDENDAGPPPVINDAAHDALYAPVREENYEGGEIVASDGEHRVYESALDDAAPPSPRVWTDTGVDEKSEEEDNAAIGTQRVAYPDTPDQGFDEDPQASEQATDPEGEGMEGSENFNEGGSADDNI